MLRIEKRGKLLENNIKTLRSLGGYKAMGVTLP